MRLIGWRAGKGGVHFGMIDDGAFGAMQAMIYPAENNRRMVVVFHDELCIEREEGWAITDDLISAKLFAQDLLTAGE